MFQDFLIPSSDTTVNKKKGKRKKDQLINYGRWSRIGKRNYGMNDVFQSEAVTD